MRSNLRASITAIVTIVTTIICIAAPQTKAYEPETGRNTPPALPSVEPRDGVGDGGLVPDGGGHESELGGDSDRGGPSMTLADVRYGEDELPEAVRSARRALLAAAATGEIATLHDVFGEHGTPLVAFGEVDDAVEHLKLQSGDAEGREILAILSEILETGWVLAHPGGSQATYVWPYFAEVPIGELTPPQRVELYRILTAIDVEELERLGSYVFYRIGIRPDGTLRYIVAGD
jgi:hypothetical protein